MANPLVFSGAKAASDTVTVAAVSIGVVNIFTANIGWIASTFAVLWIIMQACFTLHDRYWKVK